MKFSPKDLKKKIGAVCFTAFKQYSGNWKYLFCNLNRVSNLTSTSVAIWLNDSYEVKVWHRIQAFDVLRGVDQNKGFTNSEFELSFLFNRYMWSIKCTCYSFFSTACTAASECHCDHNRHPHCIDGHCRCTFII